MLFFVICFVHIYKYYYILKAEHKKINTSKSGQGGATYVSKYEYFAALHFLDTVRNRGSGGTESNFETLTNAAFEDWDDVEEQFQNSESQCSLASSTPAKRRKVQEVNVIDSQRSEVYEKLGQFLSQKVSQGKEDISWQKGYGEYVGQQLSAYSESNARR